MALSVKEFKELEVMMADKEAALDLANAMANNTAPSDRTRRVLEIALASKPLAAEVIAKIVAPAQISAEAEQALDIASASEEQGNAVEEEIES